jgi:hypothetical protein
MNWLDRQATLLRFEGRRPPEETAWVELGHARLRQQDGGDGMAGLHVNAVSVTKIN